VARAMNLMLLVVQMEHVHILGMTTLAVGPRLE